MQEVRKTIYSFTLGVLMAGLPGFSVQAANERQTLHGLRPDVVATLQPVGRLEGSQRLTLAIGLASRDEAGLDAFIQQLYDPGSTNYRHYISSAEFTARFGPTKQDYQALMDWAKASGLNVTGQYSNRLVLDVDGAVADIEKAFQVTLRTYPHPSEARVFYAPDVEPSLASSVSVAHIEGLDNYILPHPKQRHHALPANSSARLNGGAPKAGSAPGGQFWGNDFRDAYVPGTTLTGRGQNVGLLEFDGYYPLDVSNYETAIGMSLTNRPQIIVVPVKVAVTQPSSGNTEVAGDIEMAVSMAPGLNAVYVFEDGASVTNPHFDDILEAMITYTNVLQFSCSWGGTTAQDLTSETLFKQMDSLGQSFFDASGDDGAFVGAVQFPSDSPSIMQVGGTTLTNGPAPGYSWGGEVVWAWDSGPNVSGFNATSSSGGISTYYPIPSWQTNFSMTNNLGSTKWRNFPDVAANADNVYLYYDDGSADGGWGGTSFAAPLWAGYTALINEQAAAIGRPPVGFLNPALYALASSANYTTYFHDVTSGNNTWKKSPTLYYAVPGFDLCCGLGTMNGTNLINALAPPVPAPSFLPPVTDSGRVALSWSTAAGVSYQIQYTTNLSAPSWTNLGSATPASGSTATAADSFTASQRFYRVVVVAPYR